jgi:hypothetical protein
MPEDTNTPSPGTSVTPTPGTPVTGTPTTSSSVTPSKPAATVEELQARLAELEHSHTNAKEENDRHAKKISVYEKAEKEREAAEQARKDAELGEVERTKKQFSDLQSQFEQYKQQTQARIVRYEIEAQASKLGIIDPEAASALLNKSSLEFGEDGSPLNAEKLLKDLIKSKPYLAPKPAEPTQEPSQTASQQKPPATPPMNPGRTAIAAPTNPQGPVKLNQIQWKR